MTEENNKKGMELDILTQLHTNKDDVLAIAVVQYEDQLDSLKSTIEKTIASETKEKEKTEKELNKALQEFIDTESKDIITQATESLRNLYKDKKMQTTAKFNHLCNFEKGTLIYSVCVTIAEETRNRKSFNGSATLDFGYTTKLPKEVVAMHETIEAYEKSYNDRQVELMEVNKAIRNIPQWERRAKAKLSTHILSSTETGKTFLSVLQERGDMPQGILAIASNYNEKEAK